MIPPVSEIKKETLGGTYEHINRLIKQRNFDIQKYVEYNENLSVLDKKVQAIVIDTFKLKQGVINCLLSDDPHLVRRMLKCDWFFEDALPPKSYESDIFPNVSLSTRCKIINQLSRNIKSEKDAEELFHLTNKNYGSKFSEMILAKCSCEFVSNYFANTKPLFNHHDSEKNLINISKRFPDIGISFLEREMNENGFQGSICRHSKLIEYFSKNHPHALLSVLDKFHSEIFPFRLGKKSTKALCSKFMKLAEKTPLPVLMERMRVRVIFKHLSYEEQITCLKSIVRHTKSGSDYAGLTDWPRAAEKMNSLLEVVPLSKRASMVETVFFESFSKNYLDHPELWSLEFMEVFPEDYRIRVVEVFRRMLEVEGVKERLRSECKDCDREPKDTFVYLLGFRRAFPLLTELMSQMTTVSRREILLKEMVRSCIINRDADGLESVIKYISIRHKNEDLRVIFNLIIYHLIPGQKFINLNVWEWMEKMAILMLIKLNDNYVFQVVLENYIAFKIRNNLDAQPQVKNIIKLSVVPSQHSFVLVRNMEKSYSKPMIMLCYKEIFSGDSDYVPEKIREKLMLSLLMSVNDYNNSKKRSMINMEDLPLLVQGIDRMIGNVSTSVHKYPLSTAVLNNKFLKNKYASFLIDISMKTKALRYLVKSHPRYILNNFDKIVKTVLEFKDNQELSEVFVSQSQIDFLGCMPRLERAVREKFNSTLLSSIKLRALTTYSRITTVENYVELTSMFVPEEERFEFDAHRMEFYMVQINVPKIIRNVKPASKNLDFVAKYLKKDFLRWVLPSFYAVCHNSPVSWIVPVLQHLFLDKVDLSVKKVILGCILDLLPKGERFQYCQMLWEREENTSLKKFIFHAISRSWIQEQSAEIFEMVKKCIREAEEITIDGRIQMKMIPRQFLSEYVSIMWEFTENCDDKTYEVTCKKEIVSHFNEENISALSEEFCQKILRLYLFEANAEVGVDDFCCFYILHHSQPIEQKLEFLLGLLRERRNKFGNVSYFINRFKNFAGSNPGPVFDVCEELLKEWPKLYSTSKMFREYLLLKYMRAYGMALKASESGSELFGAALGGELRKIVNAVPNYECFIDIFKLTLSEFISDFKFHDILHLVIDNFLGSEFGSIEGIIAMHLIPANVLPIFKMNANSLDYQDSSPVELREQYMNIFRKFWEKKDDVLGIYYNLRLNSIQD